MHFIVNSLITQRHKDIDMIWEDAAAPEPIFDVEQHIDPYHAVKILSFALASVFGFYQVCRVITPDAPIVFSLHYLDVLCFNYLLCIRLIVRIHLKTMTSHLLSCLQRRLTRPLIRFSTRWLLNVLIRFSTRWLLNVNNNENILGTCLTK